ncbi:MAG: FluC/FEX family fluoride channel [Nocardioidaceae bacterium]
MPDPLPPADTEAVADADRDEALFRRPPPPRQRWGTRARRNGAIAAVVAVGGGAGSLLRYAVSQWWPTSPAGFPWPTLLVNLVGCLALGALMVLLVEVWQTGRLLRPFLSVGVIGGLTTFSTFALDAHRLAGHAAWLTSVVYVCVSMLAGLLALWLGMTSARAVAGARR